MGGFRSHHLVMLRLVVGVLAGVGLGSTARANQQEDLNSLLPPSFGSSAYQAPNFDRCYGNMALGLAQGLMTQNQAFSDPEYSSVFRNMSLETPCETSSGVMDASRLSCPLVQTSGDFDESKWKRLVEQNKSSQKAHACELMKLEMVKAQVECLNGEWDRLTQMVDGVSKSYSDNIGKMGTDIGKLNEIIGARQYQLTETQKLLGGDPDAGTPGLMRMKQQTLERISELNKTVTDFAEQVTALEEQEKGYLEMKRGRELQLARECFDQRMVAGMTCGDRPVSAKEYFLCAMADFSKDRDDEASRQAERRTVQLKAILDRIFGEEPASGGGSGQPSGGGRTAGVLSVSDIESRFGPALNALGSFPVRKKGATPIPVRGAVLQAVNVCYSRAASDVGREEKLASRGIGQAKVQKDLFAKRVDTVETEIRLKAGDHFAGVLRSMTGMHIPLQWDDACKAPKTGAVRVECLRKLQGVMQGLMSGNVKESKMKMQIRSNSDSVPPIILECNGLDGCITKAQNIVSQAQAEVGKIRNVKASYVQKGNQATIDFTKKIAKDLSGQSKGMADRLNSIKRALASLGSRDPIRARPVPNESFQFGDPPPDGDGLIQTPSSPLNLIGSQMTPPLIDLGGGQLDGALAGMAEVRTRLNQDIRDSSEVAGRLDSLKSECQFGQIADMVENYEDTLARWNELGCQYQSSVCNESELEKLAKNYEAISNIGTDSERLGNILSGIDSKALCSLDFEDLSKKKDCDMLTIAVDECEKLMNLTTDRSNFECTDPRSNGKISYSKLLSQKGQACSNLGEIRIGPAGTCRALATQLGKSAKSIGSAVKRMEKSSEEAF